MSASGKVNLVGRRGGKAFSVAHLVSVSNVRGKRVVRRSVAIVPGGRMCIKNVCDVASVPARTFGSSGLRFPPVLMKVGVVGRDVGGRKACGKELLLPGNLSCAHALGLGCGRGFLRVGFSTRGCSAPRRAQCECFLRKMSHR